MKKGAEQSIRGIKKRPIDVLASPSIGREGGLLRCYCGKEIVLSPLDEQ